MRSCVEYIKHEFGDDLTSLCDIKDEDIHITKELVVGWLLTRCETITGTYFNLYPLIYERMDYEGRDVYSEPIVGYKIYPDYPEVLESVDINEVLGKEKIVKVLPAQPNTYYVSCFVTVDIEDIDFVAFVIGVMHNPSVEEIVEIAKRKYYEWLRSDEFRNLIEKLKKTESELKAES